MSDVQAASEFDHVANDGHMNTLPGGPTAFRTRFHKSGHMAMQLAMAVAIGVSIAGGWWPVTALLLPIFFLQLGAERQSVPKGVDEVHLQTIEALAVAIDAKDNTTHQHLRRVVVYAEAIGKQLGLSESELKALRAGGLLHDIGKLAVPEHIISKPGRLTEEEFEKMKIHTMVGAEILSRVQFPYPVVPIVRSHHERWDGSGYPEGLRGEEIPIGARILAVVDSFDALSSDRQYRRALSPPEAMAVIKKDAGILYDPAVVAVLEELYPRISEELEKLPCGANFVSALEAPTRSVPSMGLAVEKSSETSSALYSIAQAQKELQILYELTQALGNSLSVDETLRLLVNELQKLIRFETIAIYLIRDGVLVPRYVEGFNDYLLAKMEIKLGEGLSGWVAANGKYSLNGNAAVEPGYLDNPKEFSRLQCAVSVPLDSTKGIIGALTLYSTRANAFTVDHLRILKSIAVKAGSTIHNALIHEAIGKTAHTDPLTGLPNAGALAEQLQNEASRALRDRKPFSVFMIDVNRLKEINDTQGHLAGNRAIKAVGDALRSCLRPYDFLARMGGDEFVLLLPGMDSEGAAAKRPDLAAAIQTLAKDFPEAPISISMGSASYPADGRDPEQLVALADQRMYRHKREFKRIHAAVTQ